MHAKTGNRELEMMGKKTFPVRFLHAFSQQNP